MEQKVAAGTPSVQPVQLRDVQTRTRRREFVNGLLRNKGALAGLVILCSLILAAIFAPLITKYPPEVLDLRSIKQPPSLEHPLGTDVLGYDVWSRVVFGSRTSLTVGFGAVAISIVIGTLLGAKRLWRR